jgi:tetratricopeptide (TPR) repeat protein
MSSADEPQGPRETIRVRVVRRDGQGPDPYANWQADAVQAREEAERLRAAGDLDGALAAAQRFISLALGGAGLTTEWTAAGYSMQAVLEEDRGDFAAARQSWQAVQTIMQGLYGPDAWQTTDVRLQLADLDRRERLTMEERGRLAEAARLEGEHWRLFQEGKLPEAANLLEQALTIRRQVQGEKCRDCARLLNNLGQVRLHQGDFDSAVRLFEQSVVITAHVEGENHPAHATGLSNLAMARFNQGRDLAGAAQLLQQALAIQERALPEKHLDIARTLNNLAAVFVRLGEDARAEPLERRALALRKELQGEQHPSYRYTLGSLAEMYLRAGDGARAEAMYEELLQAVRRAPGEDHEEYADALIKLARVYPPGDERAERLLLRALEVQKKVLGEEAPEVGLTVRQLGELYLARRDPAHAVPMLALASDFCGKVLGQGSWQYAASLMQLGQAHLMLQDLDAAEPLYVRSLDVLRRAVGEDVNYSVCLNNLGMLYHMRGEPERAEPLLRRVVEVRRRAIGEEHPLYLHALQDLAEFYRSRDDDAQAAEWQRQADEVQKRIGQQ